MIRRFIDSCQHTIGRVVRQSVLIGRFCLQAMQRVREMDRRKAGDDGSSSAQDAGSDTGSQDVQVRLPLLLWQHSQVKRPWSDRGEK